MIKTRKAKKSNRGLYIQDIELKNTKFKIGSNFKYIVDQKQKQIVIVPTDEKTSNTVSKRALKDGQKPVLDIRNKKALEVFGQADYLQIEIYENQILVSGYDHQETNILTNVKNKLKSLIGNRKNVKDITTLLNVKKTFDVRLSKEQLDEAVGQVSYQQLSFSDVFENTESYSSKSVNYVKQAIDNLEIPLRAISLFSGAGTFEIPFKNEGYDIVFAIEKDSEAVETYRYNHGNHIHHGDITEYDKTKFNEMNAPIVFGGSPCQGFSQSNQKTKFLDNPNNLLVREFIESVKANSNCKVFIMENVPQLLTAGDGSFKNEIIEELSDYEITTGVLNSKLYGDPQERKRAFIIGSKIGRIELPKPTHTEGNYMTVGDAFLGLNDDIPNQTDVSKPRKATIELMKHVPQGGNWSDIPKHLLSKSKTTGKTHSSMYRRLDLKKPSVTIVNPRKTLLTHPTEHKTLSIRECARLFSINDDFVFKGSLPAMQQQICNGICVKMGEAIAKTVKNAIQNFNEFISRNKLSLI